MKARRLSHNFFPTATKEEMLTLKNEGYRFSMPSQRRSVGPVDLPFSYYRRVNPIQDQTPEQREEEQEAKSDKVQLHCHP